MKDHSLILNVITFLSCRHNRSIPPDQTILPKDEFCDNIYTLPQIEYVFNTNDVTVCTPLNILSTKKRRALPSHSPFYTS